MTATMKAKKEEVEKNDKQDKLRIQFDISPESLAKLDQLVQSVGAHTRAEVVRKSIKLYAEFIVAEQEGAKIIFVYPDGTQERIRIL